MAEAAALVIDDPVTRKSHADDPPRPDIVNQPLVVGEGQQSGPSPEEAIAEARRIAEEREAKTRAENERLARERDEAVRRANEANTGRLSDRELAINSNIDAAKSAASAAEAAYVAARESGDVKAEVAAQKQMSRAEAALMAWENEKANLENFKKQQPTRQEPVNHQKVEQPDYSSDAKAWIDAHPMFKTDVDYQAAAETAHNIAVRRGIQPDSQAYFDFLNERLAAQYGEDHGRVNVNGRQNGRQ